jgi:hypothetical protein
MWQRCLPELPPWPVAPRPFLEEAMGSWLGRIAARYRMGVGELLEEYGLELNTDEARAGWLALPAVREATLAQLARLARLEVGRLREIQTPRWVPVTRRVQLYCAHCLFVNPVDVSAPRWKRAWLDPKVTTCEIHGTPLVSIASSALRRCRNFDQVLKLVGRLELERSRDLRNGPH